MQPVGIVIGASSESIHAIEEAKSLGLAVTALDGDPQAPGLSEADQSRVIDIRDKDAVFRFLEPLHPDVVLPVPIGRYLTTTGVVNDYFHLTGVTEQSARLVTDKYQFHQCLAELGLRNCAQELIPAGMPEMEIEAQIGADVPFPAVVKPRFGSGSRGVEVYQSPMEFFTDFATGAPYDEDFVLETCVAGEEYGVDGAYVSGKFQLILLRDKRQTPLPYRQCVGYYSVPESREPEFTAAVRELLQEAGRALGLDNCLLHADIIRAAGDTPFLIELSARPSGHYLHNLFTPMVTGVDPVREFLKLAIPGLGQKACFTPRETKLMAIRYFDLPEGIVESVPREEQLREQYPELRYWDCGLEPGMRLGKVTNGASVMHRGCYILEADSREELDRAADGISAEFGIRRVG